MNEQFIEHFSVLTDFRQEGKIYHKLIDIVFISVVAMVANCNTWIEIGNFAIMKEDWLRSFLELPNGIPSHDTLQRVFENIDSAEFAKCFTNWTKELTTRSKGSIIAIDGKTARRSFDNEIDRAPVHIVNAWIDENKLILGQIKTSDKSNEITAIPELLDLLFIEDCVITIDSMGTQKKITEKIIDKKGDYVLALKGNHSNLHEDVKLYFEDNLKNGFKDIPTDKIEAYETLEKGHGRIEKRTYYLINDIDWIHNKREWKKLNGIGLSINEVTEKGHKSIEYRYFITSLKGDAKLFAKAVRRHWGVESSHWQLDVIFKEDDSRVRKNNGAANLSMLKKIALNLLKLEQITTKKVSLNIKRHMAALDTNFLEKVIFG